MKFRFLGLLILTLQNGLWQVSLYLRGYIDKMWPSQVYTTKPVHTDTVIVVSSNNESSVRNTVLFWAHQLRQKADKLCVLLQIHTHTLFNRGLHNGVCEIAHLTPVCANVYVSESGNTPTEYCLHDNHAKVCPYWPDITHTFTHKHTHTFFQTTRNVKHDYDSKYPFKWNRNE